MTGLRQHTINTPYPVGPVHCYSGILAGELVLFDTGPPTSEGSRYLHENLDLASLKHVVITHCHVDHYGQSRWLEEHTDAVIYLPYRDYLKITNHQKRLLGMQDVLASLGIKKTTLEELQKIFESGVLFPSFPKRYKVVEDDLPEYLGIEVMPCPGHSQSDLVYVGDDWAVTGDTLLRGVFQSPLLDVDLTNGRRFDNYRAYCATIVKLAGLGGRTICPGHRTRIESIAVTLSFYITKLLQRVTQLLPYRGESDLIAVIEKLLGTSKNSAFHIYLKASEVVFMQDFLRQPELLQQALVAIGLFDQVQDLYHAALGQ